MRLRAPRVNDKRVDEQAGERERFSSKILPAYARRSPKVTEVEFPRSGGQGLIKQPWWLVSL
jgi:hypothetical protein